MNNAFALTSEQFKALQENTAKVNEKARKAAQQQKAKPAAKPKAKGK